MLDDSCGGLTIGLTAGRSERETYVFILKVSLKRCGIGSNIDMAFVFVFVVGGLYNILHCMCVMIRLVVATEVFDFVLATLFFFGPFEGY